MPAPPPGVPCPGERFGRPPASGRPVPRAGAGPPGVVASGLPPRCSGGAGSGSTREALCAAGASDPASGLPFHHHRVPPSQSAAPTTAANVSQRRRSRERRGRRIASATASRVGGESASEAPLRPSSSSSTSEASAAAPGFCTWTSRIDFSRAWVSVFGSFTTAAAASRSVRAGPPPRLRPPPRAAAVPPSTAPMTAARPAGRRSGSSSRQASRSELNGSAACGPRCFVNARPSGSRLLASCGAIGRRTR